MADSQESKRRVRTVLVKLRKEKNTLCNRHAEANFTWIYLDLTMSLFWTTKQKYLMALLLLQNKLHSIHASYEIRLPGHDFVKATKHKLTPSVYAACEIKPLSSRAVSEITYSCPTYI